MVQRPLPRSRTAILRRGRDSTLEEIIDITDRAAEPPGLYIETKSPELHPGIEGNWCAFSAVGDGSGTQRKRDG